MERAELSERLGGGGLRHGGADTVVCESEADRFQAAFAAAVASGGRVFLADPAWRDTERAEFDAVRSRECGNPEGKGDPERGWLCIPTGGSSGRLKLARHDALSLSAAVDGFTQHFGARQVDAVGFLPLHHVSGLMAWLRTRLTGGQYLGARWSSVSTGSQLPPAPEGAFVSVVPTQLQRLLGQPHAVAWLRSFRAVFVGGGPAWPSLLEEAAAARIPLSLSYGMTETAAMVAALLPDEFLAGRRSCGKRLPHARIHCEIDGTLVVGGDSLFQGYYPEFHPALERFVTPDAGRIDVDGHVHVLERRDAAIITGGEKVDPRAVEEVLRATGQFVDVVVLGVRDPTWGQAVVACYPAHAEPSDWTRVRARVEQELSGYRRPKRYVPIAPWPRNAQGKVNREVLKSIAEVALAQEERA
ncbi:MAG: AMP-binding protein [Opitutaceae bacterium]|nr:AMP-binding protein [Opitutaceae bacterium]